MNLKQFFDNVHRVQIPQLKSGECHSVDEVFHNVIKPTLPKIETIKSWNNLLREYLGTSDLTLFIRRYSSNAKSDWTKIRRGFMTKTTCGLKYAYCDNFFAHYFYTMALTDFVPSLQDFCTTIERREIPYGFRETEEERALRAFPKGKAPKINANGWKLSHLYSVNEDYSFNYKFEKNSLFPIGINTDWIFRNEYGYSIRLIEDPSVTDYRQKMIGHFIRLVHPLNYFLSPQAKHASADIGEDPNLHALIKDYYKTNFTESYYDFIGLVFPFETERRSKQIQMPYRYDFNQTITSGKTSTHIPTDKLPEIFKSYLVDGLSFSAIERQFLNISSASHKGWIAKKILNTYGINATHKSIFKINNIDDIERANADENCRNAVSIMNGENIR